MHSVFSKGTVEIRAFNSTLHAGVLRSYLILCLAISNQALQQKSAQCRETQSSNEKYTFRIWLLRLGLIGDDKEILEIMVGNEEGLSVAYRAGNMQGKLDPRQRPWYQTAKSTNKIFFTDVYKDAITGKPVVSIAVPYNDGLGKFRGAVVQGITLESLAQKAHGLNGAKKNEN